MFEVCALALIIGIIAGPVLSVLVFCGIALLALTLGVAYAFVAGSDVVWIGRHAAAIFISVQVGYGLGLAAWAALATLRRAQSRGGNGRHKHPR